MIDINLEPPSKLVDLVGFKLPSEFDYSWIEERGEILVKIPCVDGIFLLVKTPWENEDHQDRHPIRKETVDMLD